MKKLKYFTVWTLSIGLIITISISTIIIYKEISNVESTIVIKVNSDIDLFKPILGHYYIDYSERKYLKKETYVFDKKDIPIYKINGKYYYHPVVISQFALGAYEYYLNSRDTSARIIFLKCADWLRDNMKKHGSFFYWECNFESEFPGGIYGVPWFSAMYQGQGASVLLRAYNETRDKKYLHAAKKAIEPIFYDVSMGGISTVKGNDYIYPQEYPTNPSSDILNGAIDAYFGVYDYYRVTGDLDVKNICTIIEKTFSNVLEQYDTGYWSLYCRWPRYLADPHYNYVHVTQLKVLYLITQNEKFFQYSQRFKQYHHSWSNRTRYFFSHHLRQIKEFTLGDFKKLPSFLKRTLLNKLVTENK